MKAKLCVLFAFAICIATSCTKQKIVLPEPDTPEMAVARSAIEKTAEMLVGGSWFITHFVRGGADKTDLVKGYDLHFAPNGQIGDARNGQNLSGKWVISYIDSLTRLSVQFSAPAVFKEVSGDWMVIEENGNELKFKDVIDSANILVIKRN